MQKILKKVFIFLILFLFFSSSVLAIDCEYPDYGLTISYDEDSDVTINHEKFSSSDKYYDLLGIVKWGGGKYSTDEIEIDQTLFQKYSGYSCPSEMHVCEYGAWELELPSLLGVGLTTADIFTTIPCWVGAMSESDCNFINEYGGGILTLDQRKLYIYTMEEYKNSDLSKYEGGRFSSDIYDAGETAYNTCSGGSDNGWAIAAGALCSILGGVVDGIIGETIWGEGIDLIYYRYANCDVVPYEGPYIPININCIQLTQKIYEYRDALGEYIACEDNAYCKAESIKELNDVEDGLKNYCSTILQSYDYIDGQKGCVDACLTIKETLDSFKEGTDLEEEYVSGECGFSARLLVWASNILRWIKYILPVFVIILSILDFIKAIGADKDDEMKKAQKKFITRLIAAALVFIIPLIIEFVLNKMGFGYDSCGLF